MHPGPEAPAGTRPHRLWTTPAKVAGVYLAMSVGWIFASDRLLLMTGLSREENNRIQSFKGSVYVTLTAGVLYWLVRREFRAVHEARELLRAVTDGTPDVVSVKDCAGRYLLVNPSGVRLTDRPPEGIVGRDDTALFGPDDARRIMDADRRVAESGCPEVGEEIVTAGGAAHTFLTTRAPYRDADGTVIGVIGIGHDVTERRQLEEQYRQAAKMEAVGRLAAGIAHDFNNLLTVMIGNTDLLLARFPPADPTGEMLGEVRSAAGRAADLTRQLLAFSRQQTIAPSVLSLNDVVRGTEKMLRSFLDGGVALALALDPDTPPVLADRTHLEQVLVNLVVNARDAMPRGGALTVRTRTAAAGDLPSAGGPCSVLEVCDTGTGMSAGVRAKAFEPFFTTKEFGKGTGLGLAIVHGVVSQAGGHIEITSELDRGTTFTIYLPATHPAAGPPAPAVAKPPTGGTETVLLVEDEPAVLWLGRQVLEGSGYTVLAAGSSDEAVRAAARHAGPIHLLVSDVVMPGTDGPDLAKRLATDRPGMRLLFVSGYADDTVRQHGAFQDSAAFLQKPYTPDTLAAKVRAVLDAGS